MHFYHHLEVISWKICDLIDGKGELDLQKGGEKKKARVKRNSSCCSSSCPLGGALRLSFLWTPLSSSQKSQKVKKGNNCEEKSEKSPSAHLTAVLFSFSLFSLFFILFFKRRKQGTVTFISMAGYGSGA